MEKRTPHCRLPVVKALVEARKVRATSTALTGGAALGLDFEGMVGPMTEVGEVYLKLTVIDDVLIVSFKEL